MRGGELGVASCSWLLCLRRIQGGLRGWLLAKLAVLGLLVAGLVARASARIAGFLADSALLVVGLDGPLVLARV